MVRDCFLGDCFFAACSLLVRPGWTWFISDALGVWSSSGCAGSGFRTRQPRLTSQPTLVRRVKSDLLRWWWDIIIPFDWKSCELGISANWYWKCKEIRKLLGRKSKHNYEIKNTTVKMAGIDVIALIIICERN